MLIWMSFCSEFVRSHNNIMQYNCEKKLDFIKKGMGKFRAFKVQFLND